MVAAEVPSVITVVLKVAELPARVIRAVVIHAVVVFGAVVVVAEPEELEVLVQLHTEVLAESEHQLV